MKVFAFLLLAPYVLQQIGAANPGDLIDTDMQVEANDGEKKERLDSVCV